MNGQPYTAPASAPPKRLRLSIDSSLSDVSLLGLAVRGVCSHTPLPQEAYDEVETCVVEAVTNAISHAYGCRPGFPVEASITLHHNRIIIEVSEYGRAMQQFTPPSLEYDPAEPSSLPEGGMGLFIIGSVMDQVSYRSSDGKNTLSFCRYFPTPRC